MRGEVAELQSAQPGRWESYLTESEARWSQTSLVSHINLAGLP